MNKINTHVYLVSAQATPNITPALDSGTRPESVVLVVSPDMEKQAEWLSDVLKSAAGVKVSLWPINHPWNISHVQDRILDLIAELDDDSIALNATGGTKPMSIGAYEVFRADKKPIFYVHPERDELVWLFPSHQPSHRLADRVKIPHFIQSYGGKVVSTGASSIPPSYRDFANTLIDNIEQYARSLGTLNWYASSAMKTLSSDIVHDSAIRNHGFRELLGELSDLNLVSLVNGRLKFSSEEARFFANGGWLEQYVLSVLNSLKKDLPSIQDTASSVEIVRGDGVKNELDVVFLADNRLHIIECKAKNFKAGTATSGAETLYKLDSLVEAVGGLKAESLLVSYQPLSEYDKKRASEMGVKIIHGSELKQLRVKLKNWINRA
ncbi:Card1-like endonuclease domain-containing protein [Leucothrix arctica]|uniref:DUF1887 domain-containing protein n=1 Tax=Leucothrix arctica TaxID=1481894 RepID=A0A317CPD9_9GAMM|nr:DUF1887 family CARF protein [Leucothrix arctica]PWQ99323.1 DUF1887 domain-containing protein [Leucothrix arctica]